MMYAYVRLAADVCIALSDLLGSRKVASEGMEQDYGVVMPGMAEGWCICQPASLGDCLISLGNCLISLGDCQISLSSEFM
jgi:hypothetical protein